MLTKYCLYLIFLLFANVLGSENAPEVKIDQGVLRGKILRTQHGRVLNSFTGIPYAKPPLGPLRFEAPVSADPWDGVLDATNLHAICPQMNTYFKDFTVLGDEDCLYLNVYTPQLPAAENKPLPVMFFIHGGGWFVGTGMSVLYGPELLLDKDIVLVTVNYRLGPLGFLTTGDQTVPGNNGLKDQALALKWVQKNIAQFGGDPQSITLFGQSSGGASAEYHMYSPLSRDLIKNVISQSGSAFCFLSWSPLELIANRSKSLAEQFNCPISDSKEMVRCLRKVKAHELIRQIPKFLVTDIDPMTLFEPVIEPNVEGAFLPEDPIDIIISGKAANIPYMTGITTEDGAFRTAGIYDASGIIQNLNNFKKYGPVVLSYDKYVTPEVTDSISQQIKRFYYGDKPIDDSNKQIFTKMYTDALFLLPAETSINLHVKFSDQPVYYYLLGYKGSTSFCPLFGNGTFSDSVVCHGDDLLYLFVNNAMMPNYKPTKSDQKVAELITTLWTNFAKYGNPTPEADLSINVKWEPVQKGKKNYYAINSGADVKMMEGLHQDRANFWMNIPIDSRRIRIRDSL